MVGFLRPPATTSGWTTVTTGYCNSEIQDGVRFNNNIVSPNRKISPVRRLTVDFR